MEVHTAWTVLDDSDADNYRAQIKVWTPKDAGVIVIEKSSNEVVVTPGRGQGLVCTANGIQAEVEYLVNAQSADAGTELAVRVTTADGSVLGEGAGQVGDRISVAVLIPADNPDC